MVYWEAQLGGVSGGNRLPWIEIKRVLLEEIINPWEVTVAIIIIIICIFCLISKPVVIVSKPELYPELLRVEYCGWGVSPWHQRACKSWNPHLPWARTAWRQRFSTRWVLVESYRLLLSETIHVNYAHAVPWTHSNGFWLHGVDLLSAHCCYIYPSLSPAQAWWRSRALTLSGILALIPVCRRFRC